MSDDSIILDVHLDIRDILFSDKMLSASTLFKHIPLVPVTNILTYVCLDEIDSAFIGHLPPPPLSSYFSLHLPSIIRSGGIPRLNLMATSSFTPLGSGKYGNSVVPRS